MRPLALRSVLLRSYDSSRRTSRMTALVLCSCAAMRRSSCSWLMATAPLPYVRSDQPLLLCDPLRDDEHARVPVFEDLGGVIDLRVRNPDLLAVDETPRRTSGSSPRIASRRGWNGSRQHFFSRGSRLLWSAIPTCFGRTSPTERLWRWCADNPRSRSSAGVKGCACGSRRASIVAASV